MKDDVEAYMAELRRRNSWPAKRKAAVARPNAWLSQCIRSGGKDSKPLPVLANALIGVRAVWPDASPTTRCCARRC